MNVCELTLAVSHPPQVKNRYQDEALGECCDEFMRGLGRRLPVNFGLLDRCLLRSRPSSPSQLWIVGSLSPYGVIIYLFCIELLLYSKDVTFISVS
jgi:hypothetical protein